MTTAGPGAASTTATVRPARPTVTASSATVTMTSQPGVPQLAVNVSHQHQTLATMSTFRFLIPSLQVRA